MENNQFNPQAGQPNPMPQQGQPAGQQFAQPQQGQPMQGQQPMGQRPAQPQQGQPMGQQPQPMQGQQPMGQRPAQPQQGQPMGQRPAQPMQGQQPQQFAQPMPQAAPKAPMSTETRSLYLAIALLTMSVILYVVPRVLTRYQENSALGTFSEIFYTIFNITSFVFLISTLVVGVNLFVPKWSKQIINYVNSRLVVMAMGITGTVLSTVYFITTLVNLIQSHSYFSTSPVFSSALILFPISLLASIAAIVLSLALPKGKLVKDRFVLALFITLIVLLVALFFLFIFFFVGKSVYTI